MLKQEFLAKKVIFEKKEKHNPKCDCEVCEKQRNIADLFLKDGLNDFFKRIERK